MSTQSFAQSEFDSSSNSVPKDGQPRYVTLRIVPEKTAASAGDTLWIAIEQTHQASWHTYWKNPGDSGEATSISWDMPDGFKAGEIEFPAPIKLPYGPLMNYGFADKVVLLVPITIPNKLSGHEVTIKANISWLVCNDICIPETQDVSLTLPIAYDHTQVTDTDPVYFSKVRAALPEKVVWQGRMEEQEKTLHLLFRPDGTALKNLKDAHDFYFFPEEWGITIYIAPQKIGFSDKDQAELDIALIRDTRPLSELSNLKGVLTYITGAGEKRAVALDMAIGMTPTVPAQPSDSSAKPSEIVQTANSKNQIHDSQSVNIPEITIVKALLLALLGGITLNLMPCVFPVLSLKALSLIKLSEKEQSHALTSGIFYTLGILTCFGLIVGFLIFLKSAGEQIGWGFQLQNPMVVLGLAYLLFIMGLNLSGFFDFKAHLFSHIGQKLTERQGYSGTFFTGMLATVVATPCTAPFMASAIGYALIQPASVSFAIFMALGLGLSLPYLALCAIPPLRKALPRPGAWMETFRQFMAFPLFASVAWLIWVYAQQIDGDYGLLIALAGLILIAFSVWITNHRPKRQPMKSVVHVISYLAMILVIMIIMLSAMKNSIDRDKNPVEDNFSQTSTEKMGQVPIIPFTKKSLEIAMNGTNPIFINMTAAWCITCKLNERLAIKTDTVQSAFAKNNVQYLQGDWTNRNPEITQFLSNYERNGVPLYVFIGPPVQSGVNSKTTRPAPIILPQILTPTLLTDTIQSH